MLKKAALAALAVSIFSAPALAGHCPKDAKAIDHALGVLKVSADVKSSVVAMKDKGLALHKSGKHAESEDVLSEAMRTLLSAVK